MQEIRKAVNQYKTLSHPRLLFLKNSPKKPSHAQYSINAIPCPQKPKPYRSFNKLLIVTGSPHCERNTRTFRRRHDLLQGGSAEARAQSHGLFASRHTSHCSSHLSFVFHTTAIESKPPQRECEAVAHKNNEAFAGTDRTRERSRERESESETARAKDWTIRAMAFSRPSPPLPPPPPFFTHPLLFLANFERSRNELDPRGKTSYLLYIPKRKRKSWGYWLVKFEECFCSFLFFLLAFLWKRTLQFFFVALMVPFLFDWGPPVIFLTKLVAFLTKIIGEILGQKNSTVNLTDLSKFLEIFVKYILYLKIEKKIK